MQNNPKQKAEEKQSKEYSKWKVCEKFTFLCRGKNFLNTHLHIYVSLCLNITKIQGIKIQTLKKNQPQNNNTIPTTIQNQNHKTQAPLNIENVCDPTSMTGYLEL